jgi:2-oxoglutarate dehydrogenase E2 component (dihydrolipoamide succinyltransferase)
MTEKAPLPEVVEFRVPSSSVGPFILSRWMVPDGEWVEFGQEIVEVETEKAAFELPSPAAGRIEIVLPIGSELDYGALIARIHSP